MENITQTRNVNTLSGGSRVNDFFQDAAGMSSESRTLIGYWSPQVQASTLQLKDVPCSVYAPSSKSLPSLT